MDFGRLIGQTLGTAVAGPVGGALGGKAGDWIASEIGTSIFGRVGSALAGSYVDRRAEGKAFDQNQNRYVHMVEAAKRAGLNPLEVLRSGDPAAQKQPGIMSSTAAANQFDQIDHILSGAAKEDRDRDRLKDELLRIDVDRARAGQSTTTGVPSRFGPLQLGNPDNELEIGRETVTNDKDQGSGVFVDPHSKDAETSEARQGELGGFVQGLRNTFGDHAYNHQLQQSAVMLSISPAELHQRFIDRGPAYKAQVFKDLRAHQFTNGSDATASETPSGPTGRINTTTGDIRRMGMPYDDPSHPLYERFKTK